LSALASWVADIEALNGIDLSHSPTWLRFVKSLTVGVPRVQYDDLATEGPVQLVIPGLRLLPVYLYRHASFRGVARNSLVNGIAGGTLQLQPNPANTPLYTGDYAVKDLQNRLVATLRGRIAWQQHGPDVDSSLSCGCLHLMMNNNLPATQGTGVGFQGGRLPDGLRAFENSLLQKAGRQKALLPELLW